MDTPQGIARQPAATPRGVVLEHPVAVSVRLAHPRLPSWRDVVGVLLVIGLLGLIATAGHQLTASLVLSRQPAITLSPTALPFYAFRTMARMLLALLASLLFTFTYATLAAKSRRAEAVLIPLLDVLQSVPILGYLSFTVVFFVSLFPGNMLGLEMAAIFAIFTSQAWNMAFSFYQSLKTVPHDLDEASRCFRSSGWQRFWRLEVPFAMPGLIWNMMMSMSGGWFFVVASEAISVGDVQYTLPGIGSYVARAIEDRNLAAVGWAIGAMTVTILLYDQLLFRPLVAWADKFRFEQTAVSNPAQKLGAGSVSTQPAVSMASRDRWAAPCTEWLICVRARLATALDFASGPATAPRGGCRMVRFWCSPWWGMVCGVSSTCCCPRSLGRMSLKLSATAP